MWSNAIEPRLLTAIVLIFSAGALYAACRVAMRAAIAPHHAADPSRRALCQWLPVAATAIAAILMRHPEVAVAVIFGSSVAYLSLVLGMATYVAPMNPDESRPRIWAFVLAPMLLSLVAGFGGLLTGLHAAMLLILGISILALWHEDSKSGAIGVLIQDRHSALRELDWTRWVQIIFAVCLACVAAKAAVNAAASAAQQARLPSETLVALSILSPMLTLPALRACVMLAEGGDARGAVSAVVGTVLLNFCVLLPAVILLWYHLSGTSLNPMPFFQGASTDLSAPAQGLTYPQGIWRLETVTLVILGFALVPVALGRMTLARIESALLILGYAIYLTAVALSAKRG